MSEQTAAQENPAAGVIPAAPGAFRRYRCFPISGSPSPSATAAAGSSTARQSGAAPTRVFMHHSPLRSISHRPSSNSAYRPGRMAPTLIPPGFTLNWRTRKRGLSPFNLPENVVCPLLTSQKPKEPDQLPIHGGTLPLAMSALGTLFPLVRMPRDVHNSQDRARLLAER